MMNLLQIQDQLKGLSQDQLIREMQMPSGSAPQYLVLSEITRRKKMQDEMAAQQAKGPQMTVAQEAVAAAGVPQAGLPGIAQAMAPKTDVMNNTGATPMPAPMPSEAPVGMADGGGINSGAPGFRDYGGRGGNAFRAMLETDPAMVAMANRMGMTVREYLDTLPDEAINANARRVIDAQEQSALGIPRTDVFDPNRPAYDQTTAMELDETFKQLRDNTRDQEVMAMGVNPSFAYDTEMRKYGMGISDIPMPAPSLDALDLTLPGGDPIIRHITSAGASYLAPDLGVPVAGDLPPDLYQPTRTWGQRNIGDPLRALLQPVGEAAREIGQPIGDAAREIGQPIGDAAREIGQPIGDALSAAFAPQATPVLDRRAQFEPTWDSNQGALARAHMAQMLPFNDVTGIVDPQVALDAGILSPKQVGALTGHIPGDQHPPLPEGPRYPGWGADTSMAPYETLKGWFSSDTPEGYDPAAPTDDELMSGIPTDEIRAGKQAALDAAEEARSTTEEAAAATGDTPTTPAGTSTTSGGTTRSGGAGSGSSGAGGMSSFEKEIMDAIGRSEKRAEQDKWLALAQTGLSIMDAASRNGTFAGAVGEGGAKGLAAFREGRDSAENTRLNLLKQLEDSRLARATLAARSAGGSGSSRGNYTMAQLMDDALGQLKAATDILNVPPGSIDPNTALAAQRMRDNALAVLTGGQGQGTNTYQMPSAQQ